MASAMVCASDFASADIRLLTRRQPLRIAQDPSANLDPDRAGAHRVFLLLPWPLAAELSDTPCKVIFSVSY